MLPAGAEIVDSAGWDGGLRFVDIDEDGSKEIATRARGTPRIANRLLRRVRDFAEVDEVIIDIARDKKLLTEKEIEEILDPVSMTEPQYPKEAAISPSDSVVIEITPTHVFTWGLD